GLHHSVARAAHNSNERLTEGKQAFTLSIGSIHAQIYEKKIYSDTSLYSCVGISCAVPKVLKTYDTILLGETIYFAHMKNDQDGSNPRGPRNVYPNPIMPEICPYSLVDVLGGISCCAPQNFFNTRINIIWLAPSRSQGVSEGLQLHNAASSEVMTQLPSG
ncbi:hypothetical protein PHMEG_00029647, partial [Phytophthora megakarya]